MSYLDWGIMIGTLLFIVAYGTWKTRGSKNIQGYLLGDNQTPWWTIGLSVMATQASAITFLSTPGQAYLEGMGFIQFYFGLPIAMIIIAVVFIPLYYRLKVYTAYEFLENRFDNKTRMLTAGLFLLQRGLAAGITIYAPAIILSQIIGWSLNVTILFIGILVIIYTVSGGTKAVSQTHKQQMAVIFTGMFIAFGILVYKISEYASFGEAIDIAGAMGKMEVIDLDFEWDNRYNIWSGIIGGLFLQLSYFGTDQSQVQRYLSGSSVKESRLGLMFNGIVKIPMQFFILLIGVLVFVFYQFEKPPVVFNEAAVKQVQASEYAGDFSQLNAAYTTIHTEKQAAIDQYKITKNKTTLAAVTDAQLRSEATRSEAKKLVGLAKGEPKDDDYIFVSWIMNYLPIGIVGLLLAVIFSAAMSSTAAELNALASTATVDIYKRNFNQKGSDTHYLNASRLLTMLFGVLAIIFAMISSYFENLIQAVNIIGSLFYGTILGVFIAAFFFKSIKGSAVFIAALLAEMVVIPLYMIKHYEVPGLEFLYIEYLWLNLIGCGAVIGFGLILQLVFFRKR